MGDSSLKDEIIALLTGVEEEEDKKVIHFKPKKIFEIKPVKISTTDSRIPFIKGAYNLLTGRGGVGKSLVALMTMVEHLIKNPTEHSISFFSEDFKLEVEDRLKASCYLMNADYNDIAHRCHFITVDNDDRVVWAYKTNKKYITEDVYLDSFLEFCLVNNVKFIILDPLNRFHNLTENDNDEMAWLTKGVFGRIAKETEAAVIVIHHSSKDIENGGGKSRGAGTISDSARLGYNLSVTKEAGTVLLSVIKDNMRVSRNCVILTQDDGMLDLPDTDNAHKVKVIECEEVVYDG